jgi:hypothetical protein
MLPVMSTLPTAAYVGVLIDVKVRSTLSNVPICTRSIAVNPPSLKLSATVSLNAI